jgi:hypothetical protein
MRVEELSRRFVVVVMRIYIAAVGCSRVDSHQ